jgi:hypothetical protein
MHKDTEVGRLGASDRDCQGGLISTCTGKLPNYGLASRAGFVGVGIADQPGVACCGERDERPAQSSAYPGKYRQDMPPGRVAVGTPIGRLVYVNDRDNRVDSVPGRLIP